MVMSSVFFKEVRKFNWNSKNSIQCIDGNTLPREMVSVFDGKCLEVLDNLACHLSSAAEQMNCSCKQQKFIFAFED